LTSHAISLYHTMNDKEMKKVTA